MRPPPIRVRLTAWYLIVILLTLAVAALAMYFGMQRAIEETVDTQLQARTESIQRFLQADTLHQASPTPQLLPATELGPADELYQITDASGVMLFQSPAMHALDVPLDLNQLHHHYRHHRDQGNYTTYYRRHSDVRVLASLMQLGGKEYRIQVATDVNPLYAVLETFRKGAWTILPLVICLAGLGGYWLTGRAMKPVHDLVHSTQGISERNLATRIAVPPAQDELRQLAETINAMLARLEAAFARITRFTADASHELRTPIAVIRTTAEVILERERSAAEVTEMVKLILHESESTTSLIEQLLTLARADAETNELALEGLDLRSVVHDVDGGGRTLAEARGLHWQVEVPSEAVTILGDRVNLRRLLMLLVDNACRYTEPGGSVHIKLSTQGNLIVIEVKDSGIGIPADEVSRVFDRFYRASNARFFNTEGTGLGLPIARWIAAAHGGTLTAHSTIGSGTSLSIVIPRKNQGGSARPDSERLT